VQTFRSSSNSPNFQNIPKRDVEIMNICRGAIFPRKGHQFLDADFKGIEVSVAACYHKDPTMIKYLVDKFDMHGDMSKQIFLLDSPDKTLRSAAKNGFVFPQFYGDYYKNCAKSLACTWGKLSEGKWNNGMGIPLGESTLGEHLLNKNITSLNKFTEHLRMVEDDFWNNRFKVYKAWKEKWWNAYQKNGYVDLLTGFRCTGVMNKKEAINYPIQGAAFHCLLWSFIRLDEIMREEKWDSRLVGQIHDAITFDILPEELDHVVKTVKRVTEKELPEHFNWINVPMSIELELADVDKSWAQLKEFKA
jgi:DNA polymerase I-like protein with 3'-5' exonuclease and polymerase domains